MRDILVFLIIFGLLPSCFLRPWIGVLVFSWIGYMNPHRMAFGSAYDFPFAQIVALVTFAGFFMLVARTGFPKIHWRRETVLLLLLWIMFYITTNFALLPEYAWPRFSDISKILVFTFLTIMLIDDKRKLRYLVLVMSLSIGLYGLKGGLFAVATGGEYSVYGPPGSFIEDNTAVGVALAMVIPMLFFLARTEKNKWFKLFLRFCFFFSVLATIFTYSRGAFLGLLVVFVLLFFHFRTRMKVLTVVAALVALPFAISLIPEQYIDRVQTIQTYEQDGSANARLTAWKAAWLVTKAHPLTGGGFQVIDDVPTVQAYLPEFTSSAVGVHSVYFEVLAENGFITFAIYLALLFGTMLSARWLMSGKKGPGKDPQFVQYGAMFYVSLWAFAVTGMFLEFASFDLYYQIIAAVVVSRVLAEKESLATSALPETDRSARHAPGRTPIRVPAAARSTLTTATRET